MPESDDSALRQSARRVIGDLRELAALTSTPDGAQRVAWGPVWQQAREWLRGKLSSLGLTPVQDAAGNIWATLPGHSTGTVIVGSHLDSVPNGGWLDGPLGVLAALEALRRYQEHAQAGLPATLRLVDWADEEGARFGRSVLGSSAAAGSLVLDEVRGLRDADGIRLEDALRRHGVSLQSMLDARQELARIDARAYLELHIEQGPVLQSLERSDDVVIGTFGVERHRLRFVGQAAHAGSTPIASRRDAFLAAAATALECREIARRHSRPGAGVVCTVGMVKVEPGFVTAVPGAAEIAIDQRALDAGVLAAMFREAQDASRRFADENSVSVEWMPLFRMEPRPFDPRLIRLCEESIRSVTGDAPALPSGPLHDATAMAPVMPVVMMFARSANGLSHCKEEDTPDEHLENAISAFLRLVDKTVASVTNGAL